MHSKSASNLSLTEILRSISRIRLKEHNLTFKKCQSLSGQIQVQLFPGLSYEESQ